MTMMTEREAVLRKAVEWVESRGYIDIRTEIEGYELPISFTSRTSETEVRPDITARKEGRGKDYFEVVLKNDQPEETVTRWTLLSTLATIKHGRLILLVPHGHRAFAAGLLQTHGLEATIVPLA